MSGKPCINDVTYSCLLSFLLHAIIPKSVSLYFGACLLLFQILELCHVTVCLMLCNNTLSFVWKNQSVPAFVVSRFIHKLHRSYGKDLETIPWRKTDNLSRLSFVNAPWFQKTIHDSIPFVSFSFKYLWRKHEHKLHLLPECWISGHIQHCRIMPADGLQSYWKRLPIKVCIFNLTCGYW